MKKLTAKEVKMLKLLLEGKQRKDIVYELQTSEGNVSFRIHRIFEKMGVNNCREIFAMFLDKEKVNKFLTEIEK